MAAARPRPPVDVVVPFRGKPSDLEVLLERLRHLVLHDGDSLVVVDNSGSRGGRPRVTSPLVIRAAGRSTPGFARNAGAARGRAPWLVFIDADTTPEPDLLDRYFSPAPAAATALIGGAVIDEPAGPDGSAAARYAYLRGLTSQARTLDLGRWAYPKSANLACRRAAFEAVGGFREELRAGEDADFAYRLRDAGWGMEQREQAVVVHHSRTTATALIKQKLIWGAGGAELNRLHPSSAPARRRPGLVWWAVRAAIGGLIRAARSRDRDGIILAVFEPLEVLALEFGRSLPNERPLTVAAWVRAARRLAGREDRRRD